MSDGNDKILEIIYEAIDEINSQLDEDGQIGKSADMRLFGGDGKLDSLSLVNLIVSIEEKIDEEFDVSLVLADERAMSQKNSPFRSVGSLHDYIEMLLKESSE